MRRVAVVAVASLVVTIGCARHPLATTTAPEPPVPRPAATTARSAHVTLEFLGARVVPGGNHPAALGGSELGGLSACATDPSGDILAVSDDRDGPSLFRLSVSLDADGLQVTPLSATVFERAPEHRGAPRVLDLEGMALVGTRLLASSEGDAETGDPPALLEYTLDGRFVNVMALPPVFLPAAGQPGRGLRSNLAFEGLTRLPDERLLMAAEAPTVQDGELPGTGRGAWGRWLEVIPGAAGGWRASRQFAYPIDPLPALPRPAVAHEETGVSEALALGPDRVLALERGFVRSTDRRGFNVIRIYDVSLAGADDVATLPSLAGGRFRPLRKALVTDLDLWKSRLGPDLSSLANFEAMCPGPVLPDGSRTLLLISDNNFSPTQLMAFALFRLDVH